MSKKIRTQLDHAQPQMRNLKNTKNVMFEIPQCDSLEIFTATQLPTFFWQTNSDEVINKNQQSFLYLQK